MLQLKLTLNGYSVLGPLTDAKELDTTATELANRQDESDTSRKRLVDLSREFKKTTPEDIRKLVAPLLKSFQGEIDALSKRSKAAEAAFLSVYKKLIDLPDPVGVLDYAQQLQKKAHRVQDLEIENKQLRETLDEYNHEFAEVKNQEVTIKQLRERLKEGEDRIEAVAEARTKEKERDLQKSFAEKERQLQETQIAVSRKLGEAEQRVAALTNTLENVQSELFEVKAKYDEATSAKHDETEMIMSDLERANERATAAEREADRLRHQLTSLTTGLAQGGTGEGAQSGGDMEQAIEMLQRSNLEAELATKEREITQLVEDVQRLQASLQKLRENTSQQVSRLEEELASKNKAFKILEERLRSQEDYEEIKRELSVLKSIEFSGGVGSDEVDGDLSHTTSLEMQLLRKNKSLQSENTQIKVNCNDLSGSSSPAHSSNTKDFTSVLEEEIAETFQEKQSPKESGNNGLPSISPTYLPKEDQELKSPCSVDSGDIPPMVASSPDSSKTLHRSASVSDTMRIPPPTSHYFHPAFTNSHLLANYMSLGMGFHNNNNNNTPKPDLNSCQGLDTSMVAKTVRELLSIHNIGQRLFAKHVLGLSQGTVSELLSKPKSWDKLTEKGRESYRKMHSWATDDRNIMALKAISPKKAHRKSPDDLGPFVGTQPLLPSIQREDSVTEERIAHILNEAQQAMQQKRSVEESWSKEQNNVMINNYLDMARHYAGPHFPLMSPGRIHTSLHEHSRKLSDTDRRDKQNDPEMSSKEMVERIYRQELIKLAQAAENAGNIAASALYQRELARLAQNVRMRDDPEPGEVRHVHSSPENRLKVKQEKSERPEDLTMGQCNGPIDLSKRSPSTPSTPTSGGSDKSVNSSSAHVGSAFFQMHPKMMNGHEQGDRGMKSESQSSPHAAFPQFSPSDTSSPLQRMQNIANSLMNRSQIGTPCNKPLKAVLPPITQEEFDSYANINTEDLVKQVKETLSQYSISQRLFGESVLGLSQGSVSDLLARPKPWHMLTQKGREPFIRMQLFLEDAEAIPKLVASQYHIAPDKLMRSNSVSKEHDLDHVTLWQNMRASLPLGGLPLVSPSLGLGMAAFSQVPQSDMKPSSTPSRAPHVPLMYPSVSCGSNSEPLDGGGSQVSHGTPAFFPPPHPASHSPLQTQSNWNTFSYPSSMLEVVAMTSEIDTLDLTGRVKDVLQFNNLGQKLFGEAVLGLSQGSVSELLSKPKPWHMLSIKGREPFIKMHLWLSNPNNVERLKSYQNEIKANRRRRHSLEDRYDSSIALPKRPRVFFSEEQKERLRQAYNRDPYPNQSTIEALASALGVGVKTVINWFHNHRMRAKQQQHSSSPTTPYSDYSQSGMGKEESNDDNSNNSDLSSFSENREALAALGFRFINSDNNQWMFPKFEPMASKSGSQGSDNIDESEGDDGDYDEIDDDAKDDDANIAKDVDKDSENMEMDKDESGSEDSPNEKNENDNGDELFKGQVSSVVPSAGANRRKRSHPQYVSAGRHLDRTVNITTQDRSEEHDRENMDGQISCLEVKENKENVNCQEEGSVENVKRNIDSLEGKTNCTIEGKLSPTLS
ncbi:homeobox protein cut-like 1 isoform X2 [Dreissena polymorpha]|uniref:homeobox protein cut-like 1 isoform X2 n=1 Tax=Dreissena polymorpha TaxID=45954 RepID=UPI002264DC2D|nr:homeobox protein cut-like 1 isoform X2 [Dreissena polymorpha]